MSNITSMRILRDRMLKAFQEFEEGKIDFTHLAALSKASDSIINGLKSEMQYAILTNQQPQIPFYGEGSGISLDKKDIKKLL